MVGNRKKLDYKISNLVKLIFIHFLNLSFQGVCFKSWKKTRWKRGEPFGLAIHRGKRGLKFGASYKWAANFKFVWRFH